MTNYFFIGLLIILFGFCLIRNIPAYNYFTQGAREAIDICVSVAPFLVAIFVFVELFRISGLSDIFARFFAPVLSVFGIPAELAEMIILRPFTGSGSIALLNDICAEYGADSYIARSAAVVMSSSETLFYITAVYFGTVKAKKLSYAVPVALFCAFVGTILSCFLCRIM